MKIVVLAGGYSPEREVSLTSGSLIANALIKNGHSVLLLDVYCGIKELPRNPFSLFQTEATYSHTISEEVPDLKKLKEENGGTESLIGPNVLWLCRMADRVFLALHGAMGENGQLQATLDNYGIHYTGSGYVGLLATPRITERPVHHQLPEFTQTHVHRVSDAIQPSVKRSEKQRRKGKI